MYRRMGKSMQLPTECRNMYNNTGDVKSKLHSQSLRKGRLKKKNRHQTLGLLKRRDGFKRGSFRAKSHSRGGCGDLSHGAWLV